MYIQEIYCKIQPGPFAWYQIAGPKEARLWLISSTQSSGYIGGHGANSLYYDSINVPEEGSKQEKVEQFLESQLKGSNDEYMENQSEEDG